MPHACALAAAALLSLLAAPAHASALAPCLRDAAAPAQPPCTQMLPPCPQPEPPCQR